MKLGIGTVQFGLDYGISNKEGKTPPDEVVRILEIAKENCIRIIDTAALYGSSEEALGEVLPQGHSFDIVTKTPKFSESISETDVLLLEETYHQSLQKLKQSSLYGLLFHNADDLLASKGYLLWDKMMELKSRGLVRKIGVSVYTGAQIDKILEKYAIDLIQIPLNILDQRLLRAGYLEKLKRAGVEIHVRSVFLQGLLLMDPETLPPYFNSVKEHLRKYHLYLREKNLTPLQSALGFVLGIKEVDAVICGVNNYVQLLELCSAAKSSAIENFDRFALSDEAILNPAQWKMAGERS